MSWKVEVKVFRENSFCQNGITLATKEEADAYARDLVMRWTAVDEWRSVEVDTAENPVNYKWENGEAIRLSP